MRLKFNNDNFDSKAEFKLIILDYIFPLLGIKDSNLELVSPIDQNINIVDLVFFSDGKFFFPSLKSKFVYYIPVTSKYSNDNFECQKVVLRGLVYVSYNDLNSTSKQKIITKQSHNVLQITNILSNSQFVIGYLLKKKEMPIL